MLYYDMLYYTINIIIQEQEEFLLPIQDRNCYIKCFKIQTSKPYANVCQFRSMTLDYAIWTCFNSFLFAVFIHKYFYNQFQEI